MFRDTVAFANVVNGTGSWVLTDDLEVYERIQHGLSSGAVDWVYIGRGHGRDVEEPNGTRRGATGTSEVFIRAQMRAWLRLHVGMNEEQFRIQFSSFTRRGCSTPSSSRRGSSSSPRTPPTGCRSSAIRRTRSRPARSSTTTARCSSCA